MPRPLPPAVMSTVAVLAGVAALSVAAPAVAAPTATATLVCGSQTFVVDGFDRGQVLKVTGTASNFVVTRAVREGGTVVFDSPAQADRSLVTCTTTTPGPEGVDFIFTGFFTPAG